MKKTYNMNKQIDIYIYTINELESNYTENYLNYFSIIVSLVITNEIIKDKFYVFLSLFFCH